MSKSNIPLKLGEEYVSPGEERAILRIETMIKQQLERTYPPGVRPMRRDQHPKAHGCVQGEFIVHDNLPEKMRHGLFKAPATYKAWIRFSSSSSKIRSDTIKDAHGMSIKLIGVPGEKLLEAEKHETTQDFVLANNNAFFVRSPDDYVAFMSAFTGGKLAFFFINGWNPFQWRLHELKNMLIATRKTVTNPLQIRYWSQTPYRLGTSAVKYSVKPRSLVVDPMPASPGPNFLQEAMERQLSKETVTFDFMVQFQTDPVRMPIEDSTIVWDERISPFETVATIHLPRQAFNSPAQMEFGEHLSFTPWHALPDHQPLGATNRIRGKVYEAISKLRHEMNNAPRREPDEQETF